MACEIVHLDINRLIQDVRRFVTAACEQINVIKCMYVAPGQYNSL